MRLSNFPYDEFNSWLQSRGAELYPPTNEWEVLRYRLNGPVRVIYKNRKGALTFTGASLEDFVTFRESNDLQRSGEPPKPGITDFESLASWIKTSLDNTAMKDGWTIEQAANDLAEGLIAAGIAPLEESDEPGE